MASPILDFFGLDSGEGLAEMDYSIMPLRVLLSMAGKRNFVLSPKSSLEVISDSGYMRWLLTYSAPGSSNVILSVLLRVIQN